MLSLWDLREPAALHQARDIGGVATVLRRPSYTTGVLILHSCGFLCHDTFCVPRCVRPPPTGLCFSCLSLHMLAGVSCTGAGLGANHNHSAPVVAMAPLAAAGKPQG